MTAIDSKEFSAVYQSALKSIVNEAEELLKIINETMGCFVPIGNGNCEIYLYYNVAFDIIRNMGLDISAVMLILENILSHEMYHSIHYADVMTESGRWLYKRKDYFKQGIVQEALAEYFALCYAKNSTNKASQAIDVEQLIREMRDIESFPKDGGYSGALILEQKEKNNLAGNLNEQYIKIYTDSLTDMPKAYEDIDCKK